MRKLLPVAACAAVLVGCSGGKSKPVAQECFEEFVQEYEVTVPGWVARQALCKKQDHTLPHPDAYRERVSTVRVEYSQGDYYVVQTDRFWRLSMGEMGEGDEKWCKRAEPGVMVTTQRFEEGQLVIEAVVDGELTRTDGFTRRNVLFGEDRLANPGWQDAGVDDAEDTDFNVHCAQTPRAVTELSGGPACQPVEPVKGCASIRNMLPIRQEVQTDFGFIRGKTTLLRMGKVGTLFDRSTWAMTAVEEE